MELCPGNTFRDTIIGDNGFVLCKMLHDFSSEFRQLFAVWIGGVAFIAIFSSLRVRTLAADIFFGLPVFPPHLFARRRCTASLRACARSSMCFLALQITERMITHAIHHSCFCCLKFGSGSPRTVGLFYLVLVMDAQTQADNVAKLDVRLFQLFTEYRVSPEVMAMCVLAGVDTVLTLAHLADDKT